MKSHSLNISLLCLIPILILTAGSAFAQCGSPANSTFPTHITVCPSGDLMAVGQVLDAQGNPCISSTIHMQFNNPAAGTLWSAPGFPFPLLTSSTSLNGMVSFSPMVGGCSMAGSVTFFDPSGVVLGTALTINSPDLNGDGIVNLMDLSLFANAFFGNYSPNADFNMDGVINLADLSYIAQHLGH